MRYAHTAVVHKHKPGVKRHFVALKAVKLANGRVFYAKAGTQRVDGEWANLKNKVGRHPVNTDCRQLLRELVRGYQWRAWLGPGVDKFLLLGPALRQARARWLSNPAHSADFSAARAARSDTRRARAKRAARTRKRGPSPLALPPPEGWTPAPALPAAALPAAAAPAEAPLRRLRKLRRADD